MKYNGVLANLTCCLNSYIIFGKDFIESSERNVQLLLEMAWRAISLNPAGDHNLNDESNADFQRQELIYSNNIEGCLVLSMALQNFEKTDASYPFPQKLPLIVQYVSRIL